MTESPLCTPTAAPSSKSGSDPEIPISRVRFRLELNFQGQTRVFIGSFRPASGRCRFDPYACKGCAAVRRKPRGNNCSAPRLSGFSSFCRWRTRRDRYQSGPAHRVGLQKVDPCSRTLYSPSGRTESITLVSSPPPTGILHTLSHASCAWLYSVIEEFSVGRFLRRASPDSLRGDLNRVSAGGRHLPDLVCPVAV